MTTLHTITNADGDSFLIDMSRVKIIANSKRFNGDLIIEFKEGLAHKPAGFTMDDVQAGIDKGGQEFPSGTPHAGDGMKGVRDVLDNLHNPNARSEELLSQILAELKGLREDALKRDLGLTTG